MAVSLVREAVSAVEVEGGPLFVVLAHYEEGNAMNATGEILRLYTQGADCWYENSLATSDGIQCISASPNGTLWAGSYNGRIWTTASLGWASRDIVDVMILQQDQSRTWSVADLPRRQNGFPHNVSVVYALEDELVFVGTLDGSVIRWDGHSWQTSVDGSGRSIQSIHATDVHNVWFVGRDSIVLHFDGNAFSEVRLPLDAPSNENLTGVYCTARDEVFICSNSGNIYRGHRHGLELLGEYPHRFYGIAERESQLYLAAGESGVASLAGNQLVIVRSTFQTSGIFKLRNRLAFIKPIQSAPGVVIFDPNASPPWAGCYA